MLLKFTPGEHVCGGGGVFAGGRCAASACAVPLLLHSRGVRGECASGAALGDECALSCADGWGWPRGPPVQRVLCAPDPGSGSASYRTAEGVARLPTPVPSTLNSTPHFAPFSTVYSNGLRTVRKFEM